MTTIFHTSDADPAAIAGQRLAVVGYGNQGRSWALNLRDSGLDVRVCVRADATRDAAEADGFATQDVEAANDADILCLLVPDDVIGGLRQGALSLTPHQEAVLDLAVEQALSPALRRVSRSFVEVMLAHDIPLEAILTELFLSGEVERSYRLVRLEGYAVQMEHHSPTSQYGQLSRAERFDHLDVASTMRDIVDNIANGAFADEWEAEHEAGHPTLQRLKAAAVGPDVIAFERDLRARLGELAVEPS